MKKKISYRPASKDDADKLLQLGLAAYGPFAEVLTPENWDQLYRSLMNMEALLDLINRSYVLVGVDDEVIAGMIYLVPSGNPTTIYDKEWCYIRRLGVHPAYNGLGIGKELVQLCIQQAQKNGEKVLALHTSEFMDAARHIYERLGFRRLKEIDPFFGKKYWLYIMEL